ncbi:MAG: Asp-tRNA(Asn)/Glu-tRNA(Gln) amidotransferase subunit GatC [Nanoarchaeota archaeon]|nr:Asp-tRNA(Asn)/Glu-tRNA(Gln) amidotransferase subunit GatC [Nanoarchaeota archaeon]MBU4300549.1 Asp-tRNA(Asn)/Glu-tRNA(Gln) amidotransferase subunit GatC [Nanoarchaeota archaeon]MBU4451331.1 Asp-tRNA(Asn)/Glu-tRNA(Gln) amidotransferase subunit GatC [Nanoarchaeota archaeon]MCG2723292.1 Asp-tRNA(Asn)/Glu-tRNA(Gln) amidotransferase subunit GatC [archaeon]
MPENIIDKVAKVARLSLTDAEKAKFERDMNDILKAFGSLDRAKTDGVEPAFQPIETKNALRDDVVEECLSQEDALSNTVHKENGFFKGPRVI